MYNVIVHTTTRYEPKPDRIRARGWKMADGFLRIITEDSDEVFFNLQHVVCVESFKVSD